MKKLAIHRRTTLGTHAIVIFIAFSAHSIFASEIYPASGSSSETTTQRQYINDAFLTEQFTSKLQPLEVQLDKFKNFLQLNQASTTPSANATLSEIQNHIDRTRQSIEEFKVNNSSDANYTTKIISLHSNATNLQTSLEKLKQSRSILSNNILEKAQDLAKLLNNFNSELDDFRDEIEKEKTARRLRDEVVDYIKHNDILHVNALQTSVNNLQDTVENHRTEQQAVMNRFKEELQNLLERKFQKEKDDANNFQISYLNNQKQQLLQEVSKGIDGKVENFKREFEDLQKKISQKEKDITNTLQISLNDQRKEFADEMNRSKNELLDSQKRIEQKEKNNMDNLQTTLSNHKQQLLQEINKLTEEKIKKLKNELTNSFMYDFFWPATQSLSTYTFPNCWSCATTFYNAVVETVWDKFTVADILEKTAVNLKYIPEHMALHTAIFEKLKSTGTLAVSSKALALSMKNTMNFPNYKNVDGNLRSKYETLYKTVNA